MSKINNFLRKLFKISDDYILSFHINRENYKNRVLHRTLGLNELERIFFKTKIMELSKIVGVKTTKFVCSESYNGAEVYFFTDDRLKADLFIKAINTELNNLVIIDELKCVKR